MVERRNYDLMPNQTSVADFDAALVLKTAAGIDEYAPADGNILTEIGIKGREQRKAFPRLLADELRKQSANLLRGMKIPVDFRRNPPRFLRRTVHEPVHFSARRNVLAPPRAALEFLDFHNSSKSQFFAYNYNFRGAGMSNTYTEWKSIIDGYINL